MFSPKLKDASLTAVIAGVLVLWLDAGSALAAFEPLPVPGLRTLLGLGMLGVVLLCLGIFSRYHK